MTAVSRSAKGSTAQSFDDFALSYDRRDEFTGGWVTGWLRGVLTGRQGETAIDLGCGTGRLAHMLAEHYEHVRAIDLSQSMIDLARTKHHHPRITFEQGDLTEVTGQYDLVVSVMTLHHVPDLDSALKRISTLVAPSGLAVLVDPAQQSPRSRLGLYAWNLGELARDLGRAWTKFRLNTHRGWIDHLMSDRFLSPDEFVSAYKSALPGCVVAPVSGLYTAVWEQPDDGQLLGESHPDLALESAMVNGQADAFWSGPLAGNDHLSPDQRLRGGS